MQEDNMELVSLKIRKEGGVFYASSRALASLFDKTPHGMYRRFMYYSEKAKSGDKEYSQFKRIFVGRKDKSVKDCDKAFLTYNQIVAFVDKMQPKETRFLQRQNILDSIKNEFVRAWTNERKAKPIANVPPTTESNTHMTSKKSRKDLIQQMYIECDNLAKYAPHEISIINDRAALAIRLKKMITQNFPDCAVVADISGEISGLKETDSSKENISQKWTQGTLGLKMKHQKETA